MEFSDWILAKYKEWGADKFGQAASISAFAKLFDAPPQLVSKWMTDANKGGKIPRSAKYINALAAVYGDEVYRVLGLVKPEEELIDLDQLGPEDRAAVAAALSEAGLPVNSDDDFKRVIRAFAANGIKVMRRR